jgi:Leucine-rich repeat (LRR) protein
MSSRLSGCNFVDLRKMKLVSEAKHRLTFNCLNVIEQEFSISGLSFSDNFGSLVNLSLKYGRIATLPCGLFNNLVSLKRLSLSYNRLAGIDEACFGQGLDKLEWMDLSNNQLEEFDLGLITHLPSLIELLITQNNITLLKGDDENQVCRSSKLKLLDLSNNKLSTIRAGTFKSIGNTLQRLNLTSNKLFVIEKDTFESLKCLKVLILNKNMISRVMPFAFSELRSLQKLSLNSNILDFIECHAFSGLKSLQYIDLGYNLLLSEGEPKSLNVNELETKFAVLFGEPSNKLPNVRSVHFTARKTTGTNHSLRYIYENNFKKGELKNMPKLNRVALSYFYSQ